MTTFNGSSPPAWTLLQHLCGRLLWAAACVCVAVIVTFMASLSTARAQDESNDQFWLQERARQQHLQEQMQGQQQKQERRPAIYQRPTHLIRRAKPLRGFTRASLPKNPATPSSGVPAAPPAGAALVPPPATPAAPASEKANENAPKPERAFTVAVIGDSLGEMLGEGLADTYAGHEDVSILRRARENTGLVRDDYFNWIKGAQDLVAGAEHIDMAVVMIGSNDHQPLRDSSGVYDPLTPKWKQIYAARVEALVAIFRNKKIPLVWVGAPIMKSGSLSDAMLDLNDIYRENAEKDGASYVDVWDLFADEGGRYALYGPDVNGENAKLRSADGVHFTHAGARKLAQVVQTEINRVMEGSKPQIDPAIAGIAPQVAPAEPLAPARLTAPLNRTGKAPDDLRALLPAPEAPVRPVIPVKPAAGPIVALTTPVVAPDGQLVTRSLVRSSSNSMQRGEDTLIEGRPIAPLPGRADDFSWPRN